MDREADLTDAIQKGQEGKTGRSIFQDPLVWASVLVGLGLRCALIRIPGCIETDGVYYVQIARRFLSGLSANDPIFPPLYPILIGLSSFLTGDLEQAGRLISALAGTALIPLTAFLAHLIYGQRVARYAAVLLAVHPILAEYSTFVLTESLYTSLVIAGLTSGFFALDRKRSFLFALAGTVLGCAILVRPEAGLYLALMGAFQIAFRPRLPWKSLLFSLILLVAPAIILALPYSLYLKQTTGRWAFTGKTQIMLTKARVTTGTPSQEMAVTRGPGAVSGEHSPGGLAHEAVHRPLDIMKRYLINVHLTDKYVIPGLFSPFLLAAIGFGLLRVRPSNQQEAFLLGALAPCLAIPLMIVEPRFFIGAVPICLIWASLGIDTFQMAIERWAIVSRLRVRPQGLTILAVLLLLIPYTLRPLFHPNENAVYRQAGVWMRDHLDGPVRLAFRKPWVAFYAGAESIPIPTGGYDALVDSLRSQGATHLLIDNRVIRDSYPELLFLAGGRAPSNDISSLQVFSDGYDTRLVLYRVIRH